MKKYILLFGHFIKNSLIASMHFKFDFAVTLLEGLLLFAINIVFYEVLSINTPVIAGWTKQQIMLLVAIHQIFTGFYFGLFSNNISGLPYYVNRGDLDFLLLKPVDSQFIISFRYISIGHLLTSFVALPLLIKSIISLSINLSIVKVLLFVVSIIVGLLIAYSILLIFMSMCVLTIKVGGASSIMMHILDYGKYPKTIYQGIFKVLFSFIIPIAYISNVPNEILIGSSNNKTIITGFVLCSILLLLSRRIFYKSLAYYRSASS